MPAQFLRDISNTKWGSAVTDSILSVTEVDDIFTTIYRERLRLIAAFWYLIMASAPGLQSLAILLQLFILFKQLV